MTDIYSGTMVINAYKHRLRLHADNSIATFLAFWNQDGAHSTKKKKWVNWNEEIIKAMIDDIEPFEGLFRAESERIFNALIDSNHRELSALTIRLSGTSVKEKNFILNFILNNS